MGEAGKQAQRRRRSFGPVPDHHVYREDQLCKLTCGAHISLCNYNGCILYFPEKPCVNNSLQKSKSCFKWARGDNNVYKGLLLKMFEVQKLSW